LSISTEDLCGLPADPRLCADPNSHELSAIADTAKMDDVLFASLVAPQCKGAQAVEDLFVSQPAEFLSYPEHALGRSVNAAELSGPHARNNYPRGDS